MSPSRRQLIDQIVADFVPRHAQTARVTKTTLKSQRQRQRLDEIGIDPASELILPDVILDDQERGWLFLIDAASPRRHMTRDRQKTLRAQFNTTSKHLILFSAFANSKCYAHCADSIGWDTHVWIADTPDHMIHFNGERFLGPY